jgi:hypothetical protein
MFHIYVNSPFTIAATAVGWDGKLLSDISEAGSNILISSMKWGITTDIVGANGYL